MYRTALIMVLLLASWPAAAALCARPGADGQGPSAGVVNLYVAAPTGVSLAAGQRTLPLGETRGEGQLRRGDLVLLVQMQGADIQVSNTPAYGGDGEQGRGWHRLLAGHFELLRVDRVDDDRLIIRGTGEDGGLEYDYLWRDPQASDDQGQARWQLVRMPQYQSLILDDDLRALPWDGASGGVLALDVRGELKLAGHRLDAAGSGFRGAAALAFDGALGDAADWHYRAPARAELAAAYGQHAGKGEGLAGTPRWLFQDQTVLDSRPQADRRGNSDGYPGGSMARGAPANAGGGGNSLSLDNRGNSGGGGGGGGRAGQTGQALADPPAGGRGGAGVAPQPHWLVAGGGGGAGSRWLASADNVLSHGAAGGGIVFLRSGRLTGPGVITVAGADGAAGDEAGGGGGGGGGSLLLLSPFAGLADIELVLQGGAGGSGAAAGGDGGSGRLLLDQALPAPDNLDSRVLYHRLKVSDLSGVAPGYQCQPTGTLISGRAMITHEPGLQAPESRPLAGLALRVEDASGEQLADTVISEGGHFAVELPDTLAGRELFMQLDLPVEYLAIDASQSDLPLAPLAYLGDGRWRLVAGEGLHHDVRLLVVGKPELAAPQQREIAAGNTEIFLFRYLPRASGQVRFRYQAQDNDAGWQHTLFLDPRCDGESSHVGRGLSQWLDSEAGQPVCVRVRVEVPEAFTGEPLGMTVIAETRLPQTPLPVQVPELRSRIDIRVVE